ncbi:chemotaxis protein CheW [Marichromatium bheemlicum]|uniref:Chemotaxis protein CheW n=1 Tax=Marichromatium bheemlicum TaxID=365339 RepID=A0ABX1I5J6_9GAMM|nr:chemotaxis protein CheW [Marichromatium bheemlicum]NKN32859.1 chemotaxis protein CheW [Marichromatium bheemlicum]
MAETPTTGAELQALIRQLDASCRAQRTALPHDAPPPDSWAAVLFRVRDLKFLTPLEQIAEVLEVPVEITRVPGTHPWFLGVANNRGTLLPISDLAVLTQGGQSGAHHAPPGRRRARDRVLVVRQGESPCGLVVSETLGMRHVRHDARSPTLPEGLGASARYVERAYQVDDEAVAVLRLERLLADPLFNAALG